MAARRAGMRGGGNGKIEKEREGKEGRTGARKAQLAAALLEWLDSGNAASESAAGGAPEWMAPGRPPRNMASISYLNQRAAAGSHGRVLTLRPRQHLHDQARRRGAYCCACALKDSAGRLRGITNNVTRVQTPWCQEAEEQRGKAKGSRSAARPGRGDERPGRRRDRGGGEGRQRHPGRQLASGGGDPHRSEK